MFKVLALDGGGIKGTYTAAVLDEIQKTLPNKRSIVEYFDLIVGTSTGGIIALGLANKLSTAEVLSIYKDSGPDIFPLANSGPKGLIDWMFQTKYDPDGLRTSLANIFGNRELDESTENVAITSFDTANASPVVFRSLYGKGTTRYENLKVVDVALATSAAPTYFPAASAGETYMIDGGVWANCPALVGLTEAKAHFNQRLNDIRILSIGTTTEPKFVNKSQQQGGIVDWAKPIPSTIMHASKISVLAHTSELAGHLQRIDTVVQAGRFNLDDVSAVGDLESLGRDEAHKNMDLCKGKFFRRLATHRQVAS